MQNDSDNDYNNTATLVIIFGGYIAHGNNNINNANNNINGVTIEQNNIKESYED